MSSNSEQHIPISVMEDVLRVALGTAARVLAPDSLSNDMDDVSRSTEEDKQAAQQAKLLVLPGDIILVRTPGLFYSFWRSLTQSRYDHAVVVMDKEKVLHIGPPRTRYLPLERLFLPRRKPAVFRLGIPQDEKLKVVQELSKLHGCKYDLFRAYGFILRLALSNHVLSNLCSLNNLQNHQPLSSTNKRDGWICTDAILSILLESSPTFKSQMNRMEKKLVKDYERHGSASLSDFLRIHHHFPQLLERIPLPTKYYAVEPPYPSTLSWKKYMEWITQLFMKMEVQPSKNKQIQLFLYVLTFLVLVKHRQYVFRLLWKFVQLAMMKKLLLSSMDYIPISYSQPPSSKL